MSAVTTRRLPRLWWLGAAVLVLLAISVLRVVTGAEDLASSGTVRATLIALVPIMLAGLGGLWSERAGVVNIGLEGMMVLGTYGAGYFGYHYGAWAGVAGALLMGAIGGLIHATATVVFGVDHIISGVAINIIAVGAVQYLAALTFVGLPGGGQTQSPKLDNVGSITIGPLSDALGEVEEQDIFFVSELAAVARALVTNLSLLVVLAFVLLVLTYWVLWRTSFGLRLRSTGESPSAAESLGVAVLRYKFVAVLISGALAGLAGGFLASIQVSKTTMGHHHFATHFQPRRHLVAAQRQGHRTDGTGIGGNVLAGLAIATGGRPHQLPVQVQQGNGQPVQLGLGHIIHGVRHIQSLTHSLVEGTQLVIIKGVVQAEHGHFVLHLIERFQRHIAYPLGG